jgi:imidazolonepropionase-like amidohydrolase
VSARTLLLSLLACGIGTAQAQTVLIRDATVHTAAAAGVLEHTDILIREGRIAELGPHVNAPPDAQVIEAAGRPVTPGFFGGVGYMGMDEVGQEPSVADYAVRLGAMRPEFDISLAFDPDSTVLGVNRTRGVTFSQLAPSSESGRRGEGGSIVSGEGALARLDGTLAAAHALFVQTGGDYSKLAGGSRAAQFMLLDQAITEVRQPKLLLANDERLLTPAGRSVFAGYLNGGGRIVFYADRAADIRRIIELTRREHLHTVIRGGAEAWRVAAPLAAAAIPVVLDPYVDLPDTLDSVGSTLENAARLQLAGVKIAFSFGDPDPHSMFKLRQGAGIAVAHGLPYEAAVAAMTRNPAEIFGVADRNGEIERGRVADLVLWSGDPLEVTSLADEVFIQGARQQMRSRQTELRDRYLPKVLSHTAR